MIKPLEEDYIKSHAYVPEHITSYVIATSQGEPFLFGNYLFYKMKNNLFFIGYPLNGPFKEKVMKEALDAAFKSVKPEHAAFISPKISKLTHDSYHKMESDSYYKLNLSSLNINQKLRNMINRASRELYIEKKQGISDEHIRLISEFLSSHKVDQAMRFIFENIPKYIISTPTAWVFSARDKEGRLAAFDIAEFGAKDCAFYMFNFMSRQCYVPGASDILLYEVIKAVREQGKPFINLGLGVNEGVRFFKKKWGGASFLDYELYRYQPSNAETLKSLFQKL